jgi:MFS family permease
METVLRILPIRPTLVEAASCRFAPQCGRIPHRQGPFWLERISFILQSFLRFAHLSQLLFIKESNVNWDLYFRLSALMFLEFAIWGAWMPVLAVRLLGLLRMTGKQTGWIYATFPLACIFAPLASGYMADKWINAEWIILAAHAIGAVLLFVAAKQTKFWNLFLAMFLYSICYTATLPLVNKMLDLYFPADDAARGWVQPWVFLWAPVAWALVGYLLTGIRQWRKSVGDGADSLYFASVLSLIMVGVCLIQPSAKITSSVENPMREAMAMLGNYHYLVFILAQMVVVGMQQFYFLGTGQFMQDRGISGKNISAAMGIAQAVQAAATMLLLGYLLGSPIGFKGTFIVGALCWSVLFATYIFTKKALPVVIIQAFHGLAYVFFVISGQIFVNAVAPKSILGSAQSIIFIATSGIGLFVGTQLAGMVMEKNSIGGKFQWSKIWAVPLGITLAGAIAVAVLFHVPDKSEFQQEKASQDKAAVAMNQ